MTTSDATVAVPDEGERDPDDGVAPDRERAKHDDFYSGLIKLNRFWEDNPELIEKAVSTSGLLLSGPGADTIVRSITADLGRPKLRDSNPAYSFVTLSYPLGGKVALTVTCDRKSIGHPITVTEPHESWGWDVDLAEEAK